MKILCCILIFVFNVWLIKWWVERKWRRYVEARIPRFKPYAEGLEEARLRLMIRKDTYAEVRKIHEKLIF